MKKSRRTFGQELSHLRRSSGLNQRELAARVRKEDGVPMSQQYLNDIEHDRRNPPNEHLIREIASALGADERFLTWLAGQIPGQLRELVDDPASLRRLVELAERELK